MTATSTETRPRGSRRVSLAWLVPAVFVLAAILLVVNLSLATPGRRTLRFDNRTDVAVSVQASDAGRDGWLPVGTIDARSRAAMTEVLDQGDVWRFRFEVGPDRIAEMRHRAADLEAERWTVVIPEDAADGLSARRR